MDKHVRIGESSCSANPPDPTHRNNADDEEDDGEEIATLEEEVREMVKRVEECRSTLPDHLLPSLTNLLHLLRPALSLPDQLSSGLHSGAASSLGNPSNDLEADDGETTPEEVQLLRDKISSNISAIPRVIKRVNECISRIDKLDSSNETIHPAFKRKKS